MFTAQFWKDAGERAVKTFAQTLLALVLAAGVTSIVALNWPVLLGTAGTAALVSLLTSLASTFAGEEKTASLVDEVTYERY